MVVFITGLTAAEDWCNGFCRWEVLQQQKMHGPHERECWHCYSWGCTNSGPLESVLHVIAP